MVLSRAPSKSVTVNIDAGSQLIVTPPQLVFTADNWDVPQQVVVQAVDDTLVEGPRFAQISHSSSSADLSYSNLKIEPMQTFIEDNDWSLATTPYVDLGTSDNVAWDQPRVAVELLEDAAGTRSVGPTYLNTWLLDTGANTTIAFASAVDDMRQPPYVYQTDGRFVEYGVAGAHTFDISAAYRFDFAGNDGERHTLLDGRIISDPNDDISIFGPYGIVGMPAMEGRVTTFDFTVWTYVDIFGELLMRVNFADEVPVGRRSSLRCAGRYADDLQSRRAGDRRRRSAHVG